MVMDVAARYDGCPSSCKITRFVKADGCPVTWQLNGELHKSASLKTTQDIARYARSTRALLTSQAQDKTAEQRMMKIMDHAISVLQGPVGEQVGPETSIRANKQGSIPRRRRSVAVVNSLQPRIGLFRVSPSSSFHGAVLNEQRGGLRRSSVVERHCQRPLCGDQGRKWVQNSSMSQSYTQL